MVYRIYTTIQHSFKIFLPVFVIVLLSASVTSCGLFDNELKQDEHLAEYRRQMSKVLDSLDNHKERIKAFENILEQIAIDEALITPRKKNNLLIEGNTFISNEYLNMSKYKKAIDYTNIVIGIDSTSPKGFYSRGCIYQVMEEDSLAILDYTRTIKLNSDYTDAYYNRGIIYEGQGKHDEALSDYSKAIKLNPSYVADVYNNRGNAYLAKQNYDKAILDYDKVISIDTANVNAYSNRASVYVLKEEYSKALADCNKAIALDSTNIDSYGRRALIYELLKESEEAIDDYEKIIDIDPHYNSEMHEQARKAIKRLKSHTKTKKKS
ncbi:tetratricopeptide repeat protein [Dysgonomonas sp. Marseille-P4677]|uniref:tetratricopeptide repeat protein n=1 Tax=Dysgonomonas sp. Marseille-P4677 TaxID=2364790 RepID=UPI0019129468|nr:tetratricopeptide repeat protein [Dysgonomonas sp. Marseille-P4677]MBK5722213.1 tetratricopeptide repeat protein [Dysgonomonas sp. Marseille-P4677]